LADRPEGFKLEGKPGFKRLIPLSELIAAVHGIKQLYGKNIMEKYNKLLAEFGSEFNILLNVPKEQLVKHGEKLAEVIIKNREGKIEVKPGYDGVYGVAMVTGQEKQQVPKDIVSKPHEHTKEQKSLIDF